MWGENMFVPFAGKGIQGEPILEDTRKHIFRLDHNFQIQASVILQFYLYVIYLYDHLWFV